MTLTDKKSSLTNTLVRVLLIAKGKEDSKLLLFFPLLLQQFTLIHRLDLLDDDHEKLLGAAAALLEQLAGAGDQKETVRVMGIGGGGRCWCWCCLLVNNRAGMAGEIALAVEVGQ